MDTWLGASATLLQALATTMLESIYSLVERRTEESIGAATAPRNIGLTAALLDTEPRLRRVRGYLTLPRLREALPQIRGQGKKVAVA